MLFARQGHLLMHLKYFTAALTSAALGAEVSLCALLLLGILASALRGVAALICFLPWGEGHSCFSFFERIITPHPTRPPRAPWGVTDGTIGVLPPPLEVSRVESTSAFLPE